MLTLIHPYNHHNTAYTHTPTPIIPTLIHIYTMHTDTNMYHTYANIHQYLVHNASYLQ